MALSVANNNTAPLANGNGPTSFTLHVTNLPLEMDKDGVKSLFSDYGTVTGLVVFKAKNNSNQGYISFSKYSEAEHAISELNKTAPLMLNVRFKDDHKMEKPVIDLSNPIVDYRYTDSILDNPQYAKKIVEPGKIKCTPAFQQKNYTSEDDLLYPVPNDSATYNPYESAGPYHNTNLMYTRGITSVSKDGRRHISCGRGYTFYNLPEPHYDIATYLQNVYEKREKGLYEYATEETEDDNGLCKICSSPTPFRCQKCSITFYCSKSCQVSDWDKHKLECQPIPPLVKKLPTKSPVQNGHAVIQSNAKEIEAQSSTQLRRPKATSLQSPQHQPTVPNQIESQQIPSASTAVQNQDAKFSRDNFRPKLTSPVSANQERHTTVPKSPTPSINSTDNRRKPVESKQSPTSNNFKAIATSFPIKQQSQQHRVEPKTIDDNIAFQSHTFIPKDKFVKVKITSNQGSDYCVQKCDDDEAIEKLFLDLNNYAKRAKRIAPEENVKCILENDGMWYRAIIVSLDKISKVYYHDWGAYEDLVVKEVCSINGFEDRPLFCRRIRLAENTEASCKGLCIDDELWVKALNVLGDGTIIVQARSEKKDETPVKTVQITEKMANCSIKQSAPAPAPTPAPVQSEFGKILDKVKRMPNVMDTLKVNEEGVLLLNKETEGEYSITLLPTTQLENFERLVQDMKDECEKLLKKNPNYRPNFGDLVCGSNEDGEWLRGIVVRTTPEIKLATIDEIRILTPVNCTPVPQEFVDICTMGVIAKLLPNTHMPDPRPSDLEFTVADVSKDSAMITLKCINGKAVLSKWVPKPEEKGILYAPLSNGNQVVLTHVSSQSSLYVRNIEDLERTNKLDQDVAKYALNRKPLTAAPVIGQIVLAHFQLDDNYYRAIVTAINDKKIKIRYIDYGNDEDTSINELFDLSEELKEQSSAVRKIKLKDVPENVPLTQETKDYFDQLIIEFAPLKCNFTGDPLKDGVVLKSERNENVNDIVITNLKPTWEKGVEDNKKVYQVCDLPESKLGDVGDEVEAIPLASYPLAGRFVMGPNDVVACEAIEDMGQLINEYVEKTPDHYVPRNQELCIAKYCDNFYRALCMDSNATPNASRVFFIDYGNTEVVAHTDIRLFTEDFVKLPPYGVICNILSMIPQDKFTEKVSTRIDELIAYGESIKIKIINMDPVCLTVDVDIPFIRVKLAEEGLL